VCVAVVCVATGGGGCVDVCDVNGDVGYGGCCGGVGVGGGIACGVVVCVGIDVGVV